MSHNYFSPTLKWNFICNCCYFLSYIGKNRFTGALFRFEKLRKLRTLYAMENSFTGRIDSLSSLPVLLYFNISHNMLSGSIEVSSDNGILREFDVSFNHFSGPISKNLGQLTNLNSLKIQNNSFEGKLHWLIEEFVFIMRCFLRVYELIHRNHWDQSQQHKWIYSEEHWKSAISIFICCEW